MRKKAPAGDEWLHEIKFDGYRAQANLLQGKATIFTRRGYDWTPSFQSIADELQRVRARGLVLDGAIVVLDAQGRSDFRTDVALRAMIDAFVRIKDGFVLPE